MRTENNFSIIDPRLSKTGGKILASAIEHSVKYGGFMATIESLFAALIRHPNVAPTARVVGIEPDFLELANGTKPDLNGATILWDGNVQASIHTAYDRALRRGAKKAGVIDLLETVSQHEAVRDLFLITPGRTKDLDRLCEVLVNAQSHRLLAS